MSKPTDQILNVLSLVRELVRTELTAAILDADRIKLELASDVTEAENLAHRVEFLKAHASGIMHRLALEIEK